MNATRIILETLAPRGSTVYAVCGHSLRLYVNSHVGLVRIDTALDIEQFVDGYDRDSVFQARSVVARLAITVHGDPNSWVVEFL